jgi:predicted RNA-binding protein Jag
MEKHKIYNYNPEYTMTQCFWIVPENDSKTGQAVMLKIDDYVLVRKDKLESLSNSVQQRLSAEAKASTLPNGNVR